MALTGTFTRSLDEAQRLAVPKRLRDQFGEKELTRLYVSPGTDKSLALYSPTGFEKFAAKVSEHSSQRTEFRTYLRLFYSRSEEVALDAQGRIRLPEWLVEYAGLTKEVVLLGVHDHAEIWDRDLWRGYLDDHGPAFDDLAESAMD